MNGREMCNVCDCPAEPAVALTVQRCLPFGLRYLTVCSSCADEHDDYKRVQCASCDMLVPKGTLWSMRDEESGEWFCFLCSGLKGYNETYGLKARYD
jgi:hypothetical protein